MGALHCLVEPDQESRDYLKQCLGMLLGKDGNGKSTVIKAIEAVMGD